jgi:hypothetical protein
MAVTETDEADLPESSASIHGLSAYHLGRKN